MVLVSSSAFHRKAGAGAILVAAVLGACTGSIGAQDQDDGPSGAAGTSAPAERGPGGAEGTGESGTLPPLGPNELATSGDPRAAGPMPLRRLTRAEYNQTVRDLLGDGSNPANAFPADVAAPWGFLSPGDVAEVEAGRFRDAAEDLADAAVARSFSQLAPCAAGASEESCATAFIESFGRRAYRRPLSVAERDSLMTLYRTTRGAPISGDHKEGVRALLVGMLQSPQFLYHWPLGAARPAVSDGRVTLGSHEIAARLSYFLWQSMPDPELALAADGEQLGDIDQVEAHARRMLGDPRAVVALTSLYRQLLEADELEHVVKDVGAYPRFNRELAVSMSQEIDAFVKYALFEAGSLNALYAAPVSFVNGLLGALYGISDVTGTTALRQVDTGAAERFGLFTRAGFLTIQSNTYETSPVQRGRALRVRFLCETIPPPPPSVDATVPQSKPGQQTREKFESHMTDPSCSGCHRFMDPLGFALESYDGIGALRTMDAGRPIDTSGTLQLGDETRAFADARELVELMTGSVQGRRCASTQWLRFAFGREEVAADEYTLSNAHATFAKSSYDLRELAVALATSNSFRFRAPSPGEMVQ